MTKELPRGRRPLALACVAAIALGLASRALPVFPTALGKYPGDALWALMVLFGLAFLRPELRRFTSRCSRSPSRGWSSFRSFIRRLG